MKHYELVLLITPNQSEQVPAMITRYKETIEQDGGKVHRAEDWGRHQLAYLINGVHKAHYVLLNIEVTQEGLDKLMGGFKFNDAILRHLIINKKAAETETSTMKQKVDAEDAAQASRSAKPAPRDRETKPAAASETKADDAATEKGE